MSNNKVKYKFDFGNVFKLVVSYIVEFLENVGMIILTWIALLLLDNLALGDLADCFAKRLIMIIFTTIIVVIDLFFAILIFIPKRVVLTNDKICIYRFCFPLQVTFWDIRGFNDKILYSEITSCKYVDEIYLGARKPFLLVNNNSLVEIKTKNHKQYLVPLKNYESFICEVNKKIYENKKSDSVNAEHTVDSSLIDKTKNI